ncbi:MAG: hypothetical protein LBP31_03410 [Holosporales bacterium]|nr:hypothetical protein [Holosporales bacterium]
MIKALSAVVFVWLFACEHVSSTQLPIPRVGVCYGVSMANTETAQVEDIVVNFIRIMNPTANSGRLASGLQNLNFLRNFYSTNIATTATQILNKEIKHVAKAAITYVINQNQISEFELRTYFFFNQFFISGGTKSAKKKLNKKKKKEEEEKAIKKEKEEEIYKIKIDSDTLIGYNSNNPQTNSHSERAIIGYLQNLQIPEDTKAIIVHIQNIKPVCLHCYHALTTELFNNFQIPVYICVGHLDTTGRCKMDVYSRLHNILASSNLTRNESNSPFNDSEDNQFFSDLDS